MTRLGILISGRGSNFEAIADNVAAGSIAAELAVAIRIVLAGKYRIVGRRVVVAERS